METIVPLVLVALGLFLAGPVLGFVALARLRRVERRLAQLESQGLAAARGAAPARAVDAASGVTETRDVITVPSPLAAPSAVTAPSGIDAVPAPTGGSPPEARDAPAARPARPEFDLETIIAGRWLNRVGLLAVAIGVSYFLKYAIDNDWIGPRGQVALGLLLGAGFVVWSEQFTRRGWHYFADGITALGGAVMYLSLWAGASYYRFLPADVGFAAMVAVTAAMVLIALGRNRAPLAGLALVGGFLTPWLVGSGNDAQVALFSYLALLNAALVTVARRRDWRFLEIPAFVLTQIYFWAWYAQFYSDVALLRTSLFAVLFFLQFSAVPALRVRHTGHLRVEHGALAVVNVAALMLALGAMLWPEHRWMLSFSALALSLLHLALARLLSAEAPTESPARLLLAGLALTLSATAIAIRLDGHWVTLAWAVEAGLLAWTGFASRLRFPRTAAYVMFALVALRLFAVPLQATTFLLNARLATVLIVAGSAAWAVQTAARHRELLGRHEARVVALLAVAANVLVIWALTLEVDLYFQILPGGQAPSVDTMLARTLSISLLWTVYATGLVITGVRMAAAVLRWQGLSLFCITTMKVFLFDLGYLSGGYRIASSIALGMVLLAVSFLYQKSLVARRSAQESQP